MDHKSFVLAVNLIEQLADVPSANESSVREHLKRVMNEMTDEQITALLQYEQKRIKALETRLESLRVRLNEAQGELKRRGTTKAKPE